MQSHLPHLVFTHYMLSHVVILINMLIFVYEMDIKYKIFKNYKPICENKFESLFERKNI